MKKIITIVTLISYFVLACEPLEVEIQDAFNFEVLSNYENTNFVDQAIETKIIIIPERRVTGTKYYLSYKNLNGEGYFKKDNTILSQNQDYEITDLSFLNYLGESVENHKIELTIKDSNNLIVKHFLNYKIIAKTDFMFEASTNVDNIYLTEEIPLFFNLTQLESELEEDINYTFSFSQTNGSGSMFIENEVIEFLEPIEISTGVFQGTFLATESGEFNLTFEVKASNGFSHTKTVAFEVLKTDFNFTVIPEESSDYVKDRTVFHFNIDKEGIENLDYTMTFSGQEGSFSFNGSNYNTGQQIEGITEGNFEMNYTGNEITNEAIRIEITASNGVTKTLDVEYESLATDFEVIINPSVFESYYPFNNAFFEVSIIKPNVDDYNITYSMHYSFNVAQRTVYIQFNNEQIEELYDNTYDFNNETYSTARIGLAGTIEPAQGEITFFFTDSNGMTFEKTVGINWYE